MCNIVIVIQTAFHPSERYAQCNVPCKGVRFLNAGRTPPLPLKPPNDHWRGGGGVFWFWDSKITVQNSMSYFIPPILDRQASPSQLLVNQNPWSDGKIYWANCPLKKSFLPRNFSDVSTVGIFCFQAFFSMMCISKFIVRRGYCVGKAPEFMCVGSSVCHACFWISKTQIWEQFGSKWWSNRDIFQKM